ncbi:MAG TPA: protein-disulfide reductase DsbD [Steroidobacteraceae bacterium]|nr:protein-disulfide reductase DsbD [Steroidobacteraceae bacterium]
MTRSALHRTGPHSADPRCAGPHSAGPDCGGGHRHGLQAGLAAGLLAALLAATLPAGTAQAGAADAASSTAAASTQLNSLLDQLHSGADSGDDFLPPGRAFQFSAAPDGASQVRLTWLIAPGYYLYRDRIKVVSPAPAAQLGAPLFPQGQIKNDQYFGKQVIYHQQLVVTVPVVHPAPGAAAVAVQVTYQGCAEAGLCYPPITRTVSVTLPPAAGGSAAGSAGAPGSASAASGASGASAASTASTFAPSATASAASRGYISEQDRLANLIRSGNLFGVLVTFWGLGLLLAFTPCCLPMVPILSGLIAGAGQRLSSARAFALSLTYVLGMAVTYTATGAICAAAGRQVQAAFQQPWIILLFAALFAAMALSMFGLYTVQMPGFLQTRLAAASNRQRGGHFGGVAVMGALSALIVTTCVAPPLVATLAVIGQSGAIARGSAALFVMALGMGAPLLVVGTSAGRWLPKAGPWMDAVKRIFGVLMLGVAAWMLTRVVPARATLLLFVVPALAATVVLWNLSRMPGALRTVRVGALAAALAAGLYAAALAAGTGLGAQDPLAPLSRDSAAEALTFHSISSVAQLDREVRQAAAHDQPVMLDFYADWCTSCKEMQHSTFTDPGVRAALGSVRLLRADVTANNADDQALLHRFQIFGPPTIAFYDSHGRELRRFRVVGYMNAGRFTALLHRALTPTG